MKFRLNNYNLFKINGTTDAELKRNINVANCKTNFFIIYGAATLIASHLFNDFISNKNFILGQKIIAAASLMLALAILIRAAAMENELEDRQKKSNYEGHAAARPSIN